MSDCVFCKIVAGSIPSTKVYEDESCLAFRDLDAAMLLGLEMSIQSLEKRGVAVNSFSVRAREYLKGKQP